MGMKGDIDQFGARLRFGAKYDHQDDQPELEKRQIRLRMRRALEAVEALEWAIADGSVNVVFAAHWNDAPDPLEMNLEFFVIDPGSSEEKLNPGFRFNLRDVFHRSVREHPDFDYESLQMYERIADELEKFAAEIRVEIRPTEDGEPPA